MNTRIKIILEHVTKLQEHQKEIKKDKDELEAMINQKTKIPKIETQSMFTVLAQLKKTFNRLNSKLLAKIEALQDK